MPEDNAQSCPDRSYETLVTLWTSGIRDYHTLLSDYLLANSIFVAAIGLLLARQEAAAIFTLLVVLLCIFGILMAIQMAILMGRFSAQNRLWEWQLRGIEQASSWTHRRVFTELHQFRDRRKGTTLACLSQIGRFVNTASGGQGGK